MYSRNNLPKIKDGGYFIKLDEYEWIGTNWIALNVNGDKVTYFDSFGVEYIPKKGKILLATEILYNKYLKNTSMRLNNVRILLYRIYWFHVKR